MKKAWLMAASCLLTASMMAGTAFAKSDNANGGDNEKNPLETSVDQHDHGNGNPGSLPEHMDTDATVTSSTYGDGGQTVTSSTYGQGYNGLLHAIENVKDKPAGAVIADLLMTQYGSHLTSDMKAELENIQAKDEALSAAADILEQQGSVTEAVYTEKEAVKANIKNLNSYIKLGKLYDKMGKTGVKLYVNGDEPSSDLAPFIRDGVTLVPFRAISEALKAEVTWNNDERSVTVTRDGTTVKLFIDRMKAYVNGQEVPLEVPATIVEDHTVVPVRFLSEAFKASVNWDQETKSVIIYEEN